MKVTILDFDGIIVSLGAWQIDLLKSRVEYKDACPIPQLDSVREFAKVAIDLVELSKKFDENKLITTQTKNAEYFSKILDAPVDFSTKTLSNAEILTEIEEKLQSIKELSR